MSAKSVRVLKSTPARLGYSMPPEWHAHAATWLSWPWPRGISFPHKYETVPPNLAAIIREIAPRERVEINVPDEEHEQIVLRELKANRCRADNVYFHYIKTNEPWCRDHGPAFVLRHRNGKTEAAIVDWIFNAWGRKYPRYDYDDAVPTHIAEELGLPVFYPDVVMEGGSVEFNGRGSVLTTESCLLNRNRNRELSRRQIESYLKEYYGQKHVIWLGRGIVGDDTDGHIDDLARFINPTTIVAAIEEDPRDINYEPLRENLARLREARDQDGEPFNIVEVPMPSAVQHDAQRLPAAYVNFYFVNGALLVPTYGDRRNDRRVKAILQQHLPDREVIGINCVELIWGLGAIHCLTQQQPRF